MRGLPSESLSSNKLLSSNLLKTISPLKLAILDFVAKHLCILINHLRKSYLTSKKNGVLLKTSIWPNKNRPQSAGMFSFLHYPNQFLLSLNTLRMTWPKRDRYDSLEMVFKVQGVEVIKRRIKQSKANHNLSQAINDRAT